MPGHETVVIFGRYDALAVFEALRNALPPRLQGEFDRTWREDQGSEDSHGRTLWALGECSRTDASPLRRRWAAALFAQALPTAINLHSPRTAAFTLLGLDSYCAVVPDNLRAREQASYSAMIVRH